MRKSEKSRDESYHKLLVHIGDVGVFGPGMGSGFRLLRACGRGPVVARGGGRRESTVWRSCPCISTSQQPTTRSEQQILHPGQIIQNRYHIEHKLAEGGFGQVFVAVDVDDPMGSRVAIKVESKKARLQMLTVEINCLRSVFQRMPGCMTTHFLRYYAHGTVHNHCTFLVMELGGCNVRDLKKATAQDQFSGNTALRVAAQLVEAIQQLHTAGWIHRDVKPSNFCLRQTNSSLIAIIDFGLARCYLDRRGQHLAQRPTSGFHGTARYASLNTHEHRDMGRRDDLWPVLYTFIEHLNGQVPWRTISDKNTIADMKRSIDLRPLIFYPSALAFFNSLKNLTFEQRPDYETYLANFHQDIVSTNTRPENAPFDWQQ